MVFSRIQPNIRKYFPKIFLKCNQTHENIFFSGKQHLRKISIFRKCFYTNQTEPKLKYIEEPKPILLSFFTLFLHHLVSHQLTLTSLCLGRSPLLFQPSKVSPSLSLSLSLSVFFDHVSLIFVSIYFGPSIESHNGGKTIDIFLFTFYFFKTLNQIKYIYSHSFTF